ncbi:MAG: ComEC/Rec2 family competence protein, partial [Clostridia bacterium]|nr:ComEC/Rec2 family competence protein [Clostridia bacterium]
FRIFEKFFYNRFLKAAVSVAAIVFLCAVFGFTQSIIRAGAMFLFSAVAPLFMRKNDSLNSLGIAALLMMYFSPFCIFSVSFQLSVLATLAVVWVAPFYSALITEKLLIKSKIGKGIAEVMIISICAMIFSAPITIGVFGKVSLVSPFAFLLVTFPVTVALVTNSIGLLLSAFNAISFLSVPFFIVAGICTKYIKFIIENLGLLDLLYRDVDIIGFFTVLFIIFALIATMYLYKFYQKLLRRQYVAEVKAHADYERKTVKNSNK